MRLLVEMNSKKITLIAILLLTIILVLGCTGNGGGKNKGAVDTNTQNNLGTDNNLGQINTGAGNGQGAQGNILQIKSCSDLFTKSESESVFAKEYDSILSTGGDFSYAGTFTDTCPYMKSVPEDPYNLFLSNIVVMRISGMSGSTYVSNYQKAQCSQNKCETVALGDKAVWIIKKPAPDDLQYGYFSELWIASGNYTIFITANGEPRDNADAYTTYPGDEKLQKEFAIKVANIVLPKLK